MSRSRPVAEEHTLPDPRRAAAARLGAAVEMGSERSGAPGSDAPAVPPGEPPVGMPSGVSTTGAVRTAGRRIPELAVGAVLVGLGVIGALMLAGREEPRVPVLVWANDVARGQVVRRATSGLRASSPTFPWTS